MARTARVVAEGVPYHITQRGNDRQNVFLLPEDRRFYLNLLRTKRVQHGVAVLGYCLMTNRVHVVAFPRKPESLARAFGQTDGRYSYWFNRTHRCSGHLWQERFASCALGRTHLIAALAYVDLNPVRARMVSSALEYEWSSAAAHSFGVASDPLLDDWAWSELHIRDDWADVLEVGVPDATADGLRRATEAGLPFGEEEFVRRLQRQAGRQLSCGKRGPRPRARAQRA